MKDASRSGKRFNIVLSILIALLLWFYVVNVENPAGDTTIPAVPVVLSGVESLDEKGLLVTELSREVVNLKATGKRKTFLRLYKSDLSVIIDVSEITEPGDYRLTGKAMPEFARSDTTLSITERDNFAITVSVKKKVSHEIPVLGEFQGSLAEGYDADPIVLSPATLSISGPEDLMEQVSHAVVVISGEGIKESLTKETDFVIMDKSGNVMQGDDLISSRNSVSATLPVLRVFEIPLKLNLVAGGGASESDATVEITPKTARLSGSEAFLSSLSELAIGEMNLAEVFSDKSKSYVIPIPEGTQLRGGNTEVSANVRLDLPMKSIPATQISFVNTPRGFGASLVTESLQVWVRGKQDKLDAVTAQHLRVVVDLEQAQRKRGQQRVAAQVYLEGLDGVGVVGVEYSLAVNLQ